MSLLLAAATLAGYFFIIAMYSLKIIKFLGLPTHLRSEIYPFIPGGNSFIDPEYGIRPKSKDRLRKVFFLLKDYVLLGEYFNQDKKYWLALHPWHIGFICLITFHIFSLLGALGLVSGIPVAPGSPSAIGTAIYYTSLYLGVISFIAGLWGSIGILVMRVADRKLRDYATPLNFFTYLFLLAVFLSGLYSWYFVDPGFSEYRQFWRGLLTLRPISVEPATAIHILLFALFLMYLPFTRSLHYITRLFAFFLIRWDDEPNIRGGALEKKIRNLLDQRVSWRGPHIQTGASWSTIATKAIRQAEKGKNT